MQARGQVSGNITSAIQDGQVQNLNATITGQDIDITGQALQGDRLQTSQLNVRASLTQSGDVIDVNQLDARTDWATVTLTGTVPKTPGSLSGLLESGAAYDVQGNFDINLAAVLSQMPHTLGVRPGMQITGGRATGNINTTTQNGRATITAKAQVAGLAGVVNDQKVALSGPVQTALQLSTGKQGAQIDNLTVTAPFAQINANGTFQQINYQGQTDLTALQAQLGPFMNLGPYKLAGQVASKGQVSLAKQVTGVTGTLVRPAARPGSARRQQRRGAAGERGLRAECRSEEAGGGGAEPHGQRQLRDHRRQERHGPAGVGLARSHERGGHRHQCGPEQARTLRRALRLPPEGPRGGGHRPVPGDDHPEADRVPSHLQGHAHPELPGGLPGQAPLPAATSDGDLRCLRRSESENDRRFAIAGGQSADQDSQGPIHADHPGHDRQGKGALDGQLDWAAVAPLASTFLPGQLSIVGQKPVALNFTSTYPVSEPNGLLAHLNGQGSLGFDSAAYLGFAFGSTQLDLRAQDGLVTIGPIATTVNKGKLNFTGNANFRQPPGVLVTH